MQNTEYRRQETEDRIGKPGNRGSGVQVTTITGDQDVGNQQNREPGRDRVFKKMTG